MWAEALAYIVIGMVWSVFYFSYRLRADSELAVAMDEFGDPAVGGALTAMVLLWPLLMLSDIMTKAAKIVRRWA